MTLPGLPPELGDLLQRLEHRGLPVTPLEVVRLRHLLALEGVLGPERLLPLLTTLLCKDGQQRTLLQREYRCWATEQVRVFDPLPDPGSVAAGRTDSRTVTGRPTAAGGIFPGMMDVGAGAGERKFDWLNPRSYRRRPVLAAVTVLLLGIVLLLFYPREQEPIDRLIEAAAPPSTTGGAAPEGPICRKFGPQKAE